MYMVTYCCGSTIQDVFYFIFLYALRTGTTNAVAVGGETPYYVVCVCTRSIMRRYV